MAPSVTLAALVVLAVFSQASSSSLARVARDAPESGVQEWLQNVGNQLQTLATQVTSAVRGEEGAMNLDDVKELVEKKTQELQEAARSMTEQLTRQLESARSESASSSTLVRTVRDAPATTSVQELAESLRSQLERVGTEVTKAVRGEEGGLTADDVKAVVEQKTRELQERARAFTEEASRQLETRRAEMSEATAQALEQAVRQVNASVAHVQAVARDSPTAVENFNESFKKTVEALVDQNSQLARSMGDDVGAAHEQLADLTRNTLSYTMDLMRNFATQVSSAATSTSS